MAEHRALAPTVWVRVPGPQPTRRRRNGGVRHPERWQSLADCVALLRRRPSQRARGFKSRPFLVVIDLDDLREEELPVDRVAVAR